MSFGTDIANAFAYTNHLIGQMVHALHNFISWKKEGRRREEG